MSPTFVPTAAPTLSDVAKSSKKVATIIGYVFGWGICCIGIVIALISRLSSTINARGDVARKLGAAEELKAQQAGMSATMLTSFMRQHTQNPIVVFLVASLQTAAALGDVQAVAEASPALATLGNTLDWLSLELPLPSGIEQTLFGDDPDAESRNKASKEFAGIVFATMVAAFSAVIVTMPFRYFARRRILAEQMDENAIARAKLRRHRRQQKAQGKTETLNWIPEWLGFRPSSTKPPDLDDESLHTLPRVLIWLALLVYQGLAAKSAGVLAASNPPIAALVVAVAVQVLLVAFFVFAVRLLWTAARGPNARAEFTALPALARVGKATKTGKLMGWVDKKPLKDHASKGAAGNRVAPSATTPKGAEWFAHMNTPANRHRVDVSGKYWSGFTLRYSAFFAAFKPSKMFGGAPPGVVFILLHRGAVGSIIGAVRGTPQIQAAALFVLYGVFAVYCGCFSPFIYSQVNYLEAGIATGIALCLFIAFWTVLGEDDEDTAEVSSTDGASIAMGIVLLLVILYRVVIAVVNSVQRAARFSRAVPRAMRTSMALRSACSRTQTRIRARRSERLSRMFRVHERRQSARQNASQCSRESSLETIDEDGWDSGDSVSDEDVDATESVEQNAETATAEVLGVADISVASAKLIMRSSPDMGRRKSRDVLESRTKRRNSILSVVQEMEAAETSAKGPTLPEEAADMHEEPEEPVREHKRKKKRRKSTVSRHGKGRRRKTNVSRLKTGRKKKHRKHTSKAFTRHESEARLKRLMKIAIERNKELAQEKGGFDRWFFSPSHETNGAHPSERVEEQEADGYTRKSHRASSRINKELQRENDSLRAANAALEERLEQLERLLANRGPRRGSVASIHDTSAPSMGTKSEKRLPRASSRIAMPKSNRGQEPQQRRSTTTAQQLALTSSNVLRSRRRSSLGGDVRKLPTPARSRRSSSLGDIRLVRPEEVRRRQEVARFQNAHAEIRVRKQEALEALSAEVAEQTQQVEQMRKNVEVTVAGQRSIARKLKPMKNASEVRRNRARFR